MRVTVRKFSQKPVEEEKTEKIFAEQPYLSNVYPGDTRKIGIVFEIKDAEIEYFDLGVKPIFRESYTLGAGTLSEKGYVITDSCTGCGKCQRGCPQQCITQGKPYFIRQLAVCKKRLILPMRL